MKTKIFLLLAALSFSAASLTAQEAKTMYIMKNGSAIHEVAVSDIDSIIFYKPATIPEDGVLINGVVWAKYNVDAPGAFAAKPEDPGMFYQWNRKKAWPATGDVTGWDFFTPEGDEWKKDNDPSPAGWRVPTFEEIEKLLDADKVSNEWDAEKKGRRFTDRASGESIFLPAVGDRNISDGTLGDAGSDGYYWSSTQNGSNSAYYLYFNSGLANVFNYGRISGFSVRPVAEK
jgi:uncharacterized protein (TIGR02145 family)